MTLFFSANLGLAWSGQAAAAGNAHMLLLTGAA